MMTEEMVATITEEEVKVKEEVDKGYQRNC